MKNLPSFISNNDDVVKSISDIIVKSDVLSKYPSSTINPDIITECKRRIFYKVSGEKYKNKHILKEKHKESSVKKWVEYLSKCKNINLMDSDVVFTDSECNICSKVDALLEIDGISYVIKVKPVSDEIFKDVKSNGALKKDAIEVVIQLWLVEIKDGILIYDNNDNQDYLIFHINKYKPVINSTIEKCKEIIKHQLTGIKPNKLKDTNNKECLICEYRDICLNKQEEENAGSN